MSKIGSSNKEATHWFCEHSLEKLRMADIDQHYGFGEWNNLVVRFLENYRLDDVKDVLGPREYKKIKKILIAERRDRGYGIDDPVIEIKIAYGPDPIKRDSDGINKTVHFDRLSGKLKESTGLHSIEIEVWEDLTEDYFNELERMVSDHDDSHSSFEAPINVEIKRFSGKRESFSLAILGNVGQMGDIVTKIKDRTNSVFNGLDLDSLKTVKPEKKSNDEIDEKELYKRDIILWDRTYGKKNRIATYRRYAGIDEDYEITEDNLDDYALNWTSCLHNCDKERVIVELLGRDEECFDDK